jgi:hypothetical protein
MDLQGHSRRHHEFLNILMHHGVSLAYFIVSQKELEPKMLADQAVVGAPDRDLDPGVVLLEHPLDYWQGQKLRQQLADELSPLFAPIRLHLLWLEEENAYVQYAAIRGILAYAVNETLTRQYRRQALPLYGDWHSWWP